MSDITNAAAGFIGGSVALILLIVFTILIVILVKQCLQYKTKQRILRERREQQEAALAQHQRRRGSVADAVPATYDWHHSIHVEGTPPPSYGEAEKLPSLKKKQNSNFERHGKLLPSASVSSSILDTGGTVPLIQRSNNGSSLLQYHSQAQAS